MTARRKRKWSKAKVIEAIQERHRRGLPMRGVPQSDGALATAAVRYFGTWRKAMSAAGFAELVRQVRRWSKEDIIEEILARSEQGLPLKNVAQDNKRLSGAAARMFGSWQNAVIAAGLKPQPRGIWSKELLIAEIQRCHDKGFPLTKLYRHDSKLCSAARRHFGNWSNAVRAAGFPRPHVTRHKWSKQAIIEAIRKRHQEGLSMVSVGKKDPGLYSAAFSYFGRWHKAVAAAGVKPKIRRSWSRQIVIEEIQARHRRGLPMTDVGKDDGPLASAAHRYFGNWNNALVAAGLRPRKRRWNRQRVIDEVRAWKASGLPMGAIWRDYQSLVGAARRYFGSWHEVMKAAGLESTPQKRWSPQRVIRELQAWHRLGASKKDMGSEYSGLMNAVQRYFGHWEVALEAAGLESKRRGKWSKRRVVREIQNRHVRGLPTRCATQQKRELREAAARYFGNWPNALAAAGLVRPEDTTKRKNKWSKKRVIAAIQARYEAGLPMVNVRKDNLPLALAAVRCFGGWRNAMKAAGIQPKQRQWDKQLVIDEIRYRHDRGMEIASVWRDDCGLFHAAKRHFGSWHDAILAARLTSGSSKPKPKVQWSKQRVIDEVRSRYKQGLPLYSSWPANRTLFGAAKRYFGGWRKALAAAGISLETAKLTHKKKGKKE